MRKLYIAHPFALGPPLAGARPRREGIAETEDPARHLHDKIIAVLFTRPGERVMNPGFGAGLDRTVFENASPLAAAALEYRIRESLALALEGDAVLEDISVVPEPAQGTLTIAIYYRLRLGNEPRRLEIVA